MKKREFLKTTGALALGTVLTPLVGCKTTTTTTTDVKTNETTVNSNPVATPKTFELPKLEYAYDALQPHIDAATMEIHLTKHHNAYVNNLNKGLQEAGAKFGGMDIEQIQAAVTASDTAIRNNGGGHYNHSLYWRTMGAPTEKTAPTGLLAEAINGAFGSFDKFKEVFTDAAMKRFGSGWAWLCKGADGKLFVTSTPNQDNPLMTLLVEKPGKPILGIDVWEHAYYLNYQNRRADYVAAFYKVVRWDRVEENFSK